VLNEIITNWIGWPVISALLILSGIIAYFRVRNRLNLLKDRIEWFEQQNGATKDYRPDILAQRLGERLRILGQEIEKLEADQKIRALIIQQKEIELSQVKVEIENLANQLMGAKDILKVISDRKLACPYCGAALVLHEFYSDTKLYEGSEFEFEHETIEYDCGYNVKDGIIISQCQNTNFDDFPQ
jgi:DNA repair exonuclease SbcCD ATPase subunit